MGEAKRRKAKDPNYGKPLLPEAFFELVYFFEKQCRYMTDEEIRTGWHYQAAHEIVKLFLEAKGNDYVTVAPAKEISSKSKHQKGYILQACNSLNLEWEAPRALREQVYAMTRNGHNGILCLELSQGFILGYHSLKIPKEKFLGGVSSPVEFSPIDTYRSFAELLSL